MGCQKRLTATWRSSLRPWIETYAPKTDFGQLPDNLGWESGTLFTMWWGQEPAYLLTMDIFWWRKEYFKGLPISTNTYFREEAELEDMEVSPHHWGRAHWGRENTSQQWPSGGLDLLHIPQGFRCFKTVVIDMPLQHCMGIGDSARGVADWGGGWMFAHLVHMCFLDSWLCPSWCPVGGASGMWGGWYKYI